MTKEWNPHSHTLQSEVKGHHPLGHIGLNINHSGSRPRASTEMPEKLWRSLLLGRPLSLSQKQTFPIHLHSRFGLAMSVNRLPLHLTSSAFFLTQVFNMWPSLWHPSSSVSCFGACSGSLSSSRILGFCSAYYSCLLRTLHPYVGVPCRVHYSVSCSANNTPPMQRIGRKLFTLLGYWWEGQHSGQLLYGTIIFLCSLTSFFPCFFLATVA